jgi:NAD+ kinase
MCECDPRASAPTRIGLVVHPSRDVAGPRQAVLDWSAEHGVAVDPLPLADDGRTADPAGCDLIVAIGGDGTTLAAIQRAADCDIPVLGVACGSLGALTGVAADEVTRALQRFSEGAWTPQPLPALRGETGDARTIRAFNDIALVRAGAGQLRVSVRVDGETYARLAGDGCIVSTSVGSSAYTISAGGPLMDPLLAGFVLTPLPTHGGFIPPFVMGAQRALELEVRPSYGGGRLEIDGQVDGQVPTTLTVTLQAAAATVVTFDGDESHLAGLRRRGIIADSPRILAEGS